MEAWILVRIMRYILALTPSKERGSFYVQTAQQLFSELSDGYLLSNQSLPHITICQFECNSVEEINFIHSEIKLWKVSPSLIRFVGMSFIKGVGVYESSYWAELSVARDQELLEIHKKGISLLKSKSNFCINDINDLYRPHLTLARIKISNFLPIWPNSILSNDITDFSLSLGEADFNWQYIKHVFDFDKK